MEVVNAVYRGRLETKVDLANLATKIPNSVLHTSRPSMLVLKDHDATIMIFVSGKFRIMGMVDELDATCKVLSVFSKADLVVEMVTLQTMTVKLKLLGPINLHSLSNLVDSRLDLELFPALSLQKYKPVSVNVFASGSVMICGVKDLVIVSVIEHDLKLLL